MQTFLPYSDFTKTAKCLDYRRLGKQRVEAKQILQILITDYPDAPLISRWRDHPVVRMWEGFEYALCHYGWAMCHEWLVRGYNDNLKEIFNNHIETITDERVLWITPEWLGREDFHRSHQSNLIRKAPDFYSSKFPGVPNNLPYIWPI